MSTRSHEKEDFHIEKNNSKLENELIGQEIILLQRKIALHLFTYSDSDFLFKIKDKEYLISILKTLFPEISKQEVLILNELKTTEEVLLVRENQHDKAVRLFIKFIILPLLEADKITKVDIEKIISQVFGGFCCKLKIIGENLIYFCYQRV